MIHGAELPPITRNRLNDVVLLQLRLLYYAASTSKIDARTLEGLLSKKPYFQGRSKKIVDWLWQPGTTIRHEHLEKFASSFEAESEQERRQEQQTKAEWCLRLLGESASLSLLTDSPLELNSFFGDDNNPECTEKDAPLWKKEAKCFLLYFYDFYLQKTQETFPPFFFSDSNASTFGRQDLLAAFIKENQDLGVCVFCDQSRHYTQDKQGIHILLDHYLPKAQYPHLACHPYNLIPTCYFCNSPVKGENDPSVDVHGKRRTLSKHSLPYQSEGRGHDSYLEVGLSSSTMAFEVKAIRPRKDNAGYIDPDLCQAIDVLAQIHDIPGRWAVSTETNKISETLFRRMRQFFSMDNAYLPASICRQLLPIVF